MHSDDDRRNAARTDPSERAHADAVFTFARCAEAHDADTGDHIMRIRRLVEQIALRMGYSERDARWLGYDAMLHDVGKMNIPHPILNKPGKLHDIEREIMQTHTIHGERMLLGRGSMAQAAAIARSHHEAWDGSGYPDGKKGADIPMPARITAVADVLDALAADRCYKKSWSYRDALEEVYRLAGTTLDPTVVVALRAADEEGDIYPIVAVLSDSFSQDDEQANEAGPSTGDGASSNDDSAAA